MTFHDRACKLMETLEAMKCFIKDEENSSEYDDEDDGISGIVYFDLVIPKKKNKIRMRVGIYIAINFDDKEIIWLKEGRYCKLKIKNIEDVFEVVNKKVQNEILFNLDTISYADFEE